MMNGKVTRQPEGTLRVGAAHAASAMLDAEAGVRSAQQWIRMASESGVKLLVFPESFIPGFPLWNALFKPINGHEFFMRLAQSSLLVDGPEIAAISEEARRCQLHVSLGFTERSPHSPGCLWNSNILIGDDGRVLNVHRKLVPTFYEKLSWNHGDAAGLRVISTRIGRIGSLICGENGNPLSRYALMAQGEEIHTSNYPPVWPFTDPRESGGYDLTEAIRTRAAAHAFESKTFVIVSSGFLDEASIYVIANGDDEAEAILRACPRSASMVVGPSNDVLSSICRDEEGLVHADVNLASLLPLRQHHDMAGYYNRMDLIRVTVDRRRPEPLTDAVSDDESAGCFGGRAEATPVSDDD
ncbi:aliphatic nitrilase [Natronocella acetinitrilica]|uniref:Aliphatic nitrilase n=1 Tax=Natronocella acetinitrilica TaxID=414046 RepID=A0AAE3G5F7_9GAMM|nr:carbon-nitrogen hydrolase family protein [Natronocella acetinitrilica]MCP1676201.1 aliphatic nitrilase [Natronocella acetinitrilica]